VNRTTLEIATPQCVAEDFEGEIVILNMESGVYFSARAASAALWRDLAAGHSVESLVELAGPNRAAGQAIDTFVKSVIGEGLMRPAVPSQAPSAAPSLNVTEIKESLSLEAFHDMKSLLLLDPVHEVDAQIGWPKTPEA
jgi:hypothetical protein